MIGPRGLDSWSQAILVCSTTLMPESCEKKKDRDVVCVVFGGFQVSIARAEASEADQAAEQNPAVKDIDTTMPLLPIPFD